MPVRRKKTQRPDEYATSTCVGGMCIQSFSDLSALFFIQTKRNFRRVAIYVELREISDFRLKSGRARRSLLPNIGYQGYAVALVEMANEPFTQSRNVHLRCNKLARSTLASGIAKGASSSFKADAAIWRTTEDKRREKAEIIYTLNH